MVLQRPSMVHSAAFLSRALSLEKAFSMRLNSELQIPSWNARRLFRLERRARHIQECESHPSSGNPPDSFSQEAAVVLEKSACSDANFARTDFTYDHEPDRYIWPGGKARTVRSPRSEAGTSGVVVGRHGATFAISSGVGAQPLPDRVRGQHQAHLRLMARRVVRAIDRLVGVF